MATPGNRTGTPNSSELPVSTNTPREPSRGAFPSIPHLSLGKLLALEYAPFGRSAMIRFECPRCESTLTEKDDRSGMKLNCPECGQRLQVPSTPLNKTVLGTLLPAGPGRPGTGPAASVPPLPEAWF